MSFVLVQVIVGGLLLGAVYALFSSGLTLVWGMMNIVNFAHGDFVMLGMYVAYVVYTLMGGGPIVGAPLAMLVLATLGVVVYFGLIRDIMKGPMLAQILGTFGLALLLRYSVFWWFGANFLSMPPNIVGGTYAFAGLRIEASRLLAGVVALLVTLGLHLLLTRTRSVRRCWRWRRTRPRPSSWASGPTACRRSPGRSLRAPRGSPAR
ncbi:branched-chain amino acid ABC transporter permease [Bradyrhizobium sp. SEMIA]|uniref:branched-chain amino acid ABC transporter permease n=1 Tax=Bradyrhizobium sp. SEMIA TaxID=2597515 RepID=UPI00223E9498|nr:branched-chain amino acid ABC transporter permease [Bradyrhizobium sp. SEMIA]